MTAVSHALRWIVEAVVRPFDSLAPWVSLAIIGAITAVVMLVAVRRVSPQRLVTRSRAQMAGAVLEMRLYLDHPRRVLAAQGRLIAWTVIYLACLLPAILVLAAPLGLLYLELAARHDVAPLKTPTTAVLRVDLADDADVRDVSITPSSRIAVTARVRDAEDHAVYARLEIYARGEHEVVVRAGDTEVTKKISADPDADTVSPERRGGLSYLWATTDEPPIDGGPITGISLAHPARDEALPVRWWLYWLGAATIVALLLRKRFDVVF